MNTNELLQHRYIVTRVLEKQKSEGKNSGLRFQRTRAVHAGSVIAFALMPNVR